ncbi:MAG: BrxA/BrxB family bacilliredoxin [Nitrospinota bacterium]|nr:MAG: BrxA/BrxB family bacilliredoxin [Nitrospinota bacterium]
MYDPEWVVPMREELTAVGFQELLTPEEVDAVLGQQSGTTLVVINSICGCAAGNARPGVAMALQHTVIPDRLVTAFAGQEREAVQRVREYLAPYPPSSPCIALFKEGTLVKMIERKDIEGREATAIAQELKAAFAQYCSRPGPSIPPEEFAQLAFVPQCGSTIPSFNP